MDDNLGQDIKLSHDVLNYTHACLQGGFASLNMLSQLGYHEFNPDELSRYQSNLVFLEKVMNQLWQGLPVFSLSWKIPQTPESKATLQLLGQLKQDLQSVTTKIERSLQSPDFTSEDVKFLIAAYCRITYTNENIIKGYIEFGKNYTVPQMIEKYGPLLAGAERDIESAHLFFDIFTTETEPSPIFYQSLLEESVLLTGSFRSLIHEVNRFLATYKGPFSFALTDIPVDQAEEWQVIKIPPENAGYWWAYGFRAQEMVEWLQIGVSIPRDAHFWKCVNFSASTAQEWIAQGFSPVIARDWKYANFSAKDALHYIQKGAKTPAEAEQKRRFSDFDENEDPESDPSI